MYQTNNYCSEMFLNIFSRSNVDKQCVHLVFDSSKLIFYPPNLSSSIFDEVMKQSSYHLILKWIA